MGSTTAEQTGAPEAPAELTGRHRTLRRRLPTLATVLAVIVAAVGIGIGRPYRSNQNTYLIHAVGPSMPALRDDWFLSTVDPFPLFTAVVRAGYAIAGKAGLAAESLLLTASAFAGLALIASALLARAGRRSRSWVPALAVLGTSACTYLLPHSRVPVLSWVHPFLGFGGQYLMSIPTRFQTSDSGALLLLAIGLAVWSGPRRGRSGRVARGFAAVLAVLTCLLHPTYLAPLAVVLGAFLLADLLVMRTVARLGWYVGTGLVAVGLVLAINPVVRASIGQPANEAQRYFAFDRIAHHTLLSHWDPHDAFLIVVVAIAAVLTVALTRRRWALTALLAGLAVAVISAVLVELTRSLGLAMMFPWRVTVFLMPVAVLIGWVWLLELLIRRVGRTRFWTAPLAVVLAAVCLSVGGYLTATDQDPSTEAAVRALRQAAPRGVGLIPVTLEDVRLNTPVSIYVDVKSNPYTPADLTEWQRRLNAVQAAETDDRAFCRLLDSADLSWVLLRPGRPAPSCLATWRHQSVDGQNIYLRAAG